MSPVAYFPAGQQGVPVMTHILPPVILTPQQHSDAQVSPTVIRPGQLSTTIMQNMPLSPAVIQQSAKLSPGNLQPQSSTLLSPSTVQKQASSVSPAKLSPRQPLDGKSAETKSGSAENHRVASVKQSPENVGNLTRSGSASLLDQNKLPPKKRKLVSSETSQVDTKVVISTDEVTATSYNTIDSGIGSMDQIPSMTSDSEPPSTAITTPSAAPALPLIDMLQQVDSGRGGSSTPMTWQEAYAKNFTRQFFLRAQQVQNAVSAGQIRSLPGNITLPSSTTSRPLVLHSLPPSSLSTHTSTSKVGLSPSVPSSVIHSLPGDNVNGFSTTEANQHRASSIQSLPHELYIRQAGGSVKVEGTAAGSRIQSLPHELYLRPAGGGEIKTEGGSSRSTPMVVAVSRSLPTTLRYQRISSDVGEKQVGKQVNGVPVNHKIVSPAINGHKTTPERTVKVKGEFFISTQNYIVGKCSLLFTDIAI